MLTRLVITNFRSIGSKANDAPGIDIALKPLTVLVGPNGSGKSNIIEAIAFLSQRCSINGELVNYRSLNEVSHRGDTGLQGVIEIELKSAKLNRGSVDRPGYRQFFGNRNDKTEYLTDSTPTVRLPDQYRVAIQNAIQAELDKMFFPNLYLLRAMRGIELGPASPQSAKWVGPLGQFTLHILNILNKAQYASTRKEITTWANLFGLRNISGFAEGQSLDGEYEDSSIDFYLPLRSTSYGSRQTLPIIVQIFWSNKNSLLMIEEPEISLHPQAQVDMAELLATAAADGKQIIFTTHSTFLLQGIGRAIRNPEIPITSKDVAIYEIKKTSDGSTAAPLNLDERGNIKGWAKSSFGRVERELYQEWSRSLPEV